MSNLMLYQIETEMLELVTLRDELLAEVLVTAEDEAERRLTLEVIESQVANYITRELAKADNLAGFVRECETRGDAHRAESGRHGKLAKLWKDRAEHVRKRAAEVLASQIDPEVIRNATPGSTLKRIRGKLAELKLVKNPDGVAEPIDMTLLPAEMQRVTVTMSAQAWEDTLECLGENGFDYEDIGGVDAKTEPDKRAILAALKQRVPCDKCGTTGLVPGDGIAGVCRDIDGNWWHEPGSCSGCQARTCHECNGTGTIPGSVPGARLAHGVHVRIS